MTDHLQPIRDARKALEEKHAELCEAISETVVGLASLRSDRDEIASQIADCNRALGLRADGTPRKPRGEEAGSDAEDRDDT